MSDGTLWCEQLVEQLHRVHIRLALSVAGKFRQPRDGAIAY